ncbi:selT/selW/selH selenoprotein domain-containing protein [Colletotrichum musicola]|uniref:SelT/selW/selH selenoprotein domain-containing protein n=1 Tax=Colletotrichum musicola TaxID=2175873 RepID=A0A8H6NBI5_9PEZI|nr:selT/selW/selH selenoprotein domain-containing protein [Colletotrichum musicola]
MAEVASSSAAVAPHPLPRVAIQFCTQCKWMLRAAYFAQELLSTFSTSLGEVALQPATGGTFVVTLTHLPEGAATTSTTTLWDRKTDGGFPETKELKRRLRDVIEPNRDLGHVDRKHPKPAATPAEITMAPQDDKSASEVTSHLKKHPANADKNNSPLGDDARAAVAAAHANTGQKEIAEAPPPGQGLGELRRERQQQEIQATSTQSENNQACEDCA